MKTSIRTRAGAAMFGTFLLAGCSSGANSAASTNDAAPAATSSDSSATSTATDSGAPLPPPTQSVSGRIATVNLPYRAADGLVWVSATKMSEAEPFVFKGLEIKPGSGPNGTDIAVFTYEADRAGAATLKFGLVPPGKMLIGLPSLVYTGPVTARFETTVSAS